MKAFLGFILAFSLISIASCYTIPATSVQGNLNLTSHNIIGLATPTNDTDAATKAYADSVAIGGGLPTSGGTMTGQINFGGFTAYNSSTPVNDTDLATKDYVDGLNTSYAPISHVTTKWNKTDAITLPENVDITLDKGRLVRFASDSMFNILSYGATANDFTDDAEAIQDTYDAAHTEYDNTGIPQIVYWPPGEFNGNSSQGGSAGIVVRNRPGVVTVGAGREVTTFRIMDNLRDADTGVYPLWNNDEYMQGMSISGLTFEHGNNTVQTGENNYSAVGAIWCSDVRVYDVGFKNVSGTWALYLGQYGAHSADLNNAIVSDIYLHQAAQAITGDATYDHTSIRFNMNNVLFSNSVLINDAMPTNAAAFEFHGNNSLARGIIALNYTAAVHTGADQYGACVVKGISISNCLFKSVYGVGLWSFPVGAVLNDLTITDNVFYIADHSSAVRGSAVQSIITTGLIRSLSFTGNTVYQQNAFGAYTTNSGLYLHDVYNLTVAGNTFDNLTNAIKVEETTDIGYYSILHNNIPLWGYGSIGQHTAAIYIDVRPSALSGKVIIQDNSMGGDDVGEYGILTYTPYLANLDIVDNSVVDAGTLDVITFIPSGYTNGEKTFIRHISHEFGPTGNYAIDGSVWECLSNGSLMRKDGDWKVVEWTYA